MFTDMMDVSQEIRDKIHDELDKLNYKSSFISRRTNHHEDDFLYLVIAEHKERKNTFVVYSYNNSTESIGSGDYNLTLPQALQSMSERMTQWGQIE